jgi:hypothetical protein
MVSLKEKMKKTTWTSATLQIQVPNHSTRHRFMIEINHHWSKWSKHSVTALN